MKNKSNIVLIVLVAAILGIAVYYLVQRETFANPEITIDWSKIPKNAKGQYKDAYVRRAFAASEAEYNKTHTTVPMIPIVRNTRPQITDAAGGRVRRKVYLAQQKALRPTQPMIPAGIKVQKKRLLAATRTTLPMLSEPVGYSS